ncbi:hypothetical protein [Kribbella sp. NPDC000426]|uniref:hypothetical protein n=1 Tax=Kribbella sp. NPDC000426 TaxID=3154255 RepID=UPI0033343C11
MLMRPTTGRPAPTPQVQALPGSDPLVLVLATLAPLVLLLGCGRVVRMLMLPATGRRAATPPARVLPGSELLVPQTFGLLALVLATSDPLVLQLGCARVVRTLMLRASELLGCGQLVRGLVLGTPSGVVGLGLLVLTSGRRVGSPPRLLGGVGGVGVLGLVEVGRGAGGLVGVRSGGGGRLLLLLLWCW